MLKERGIHIKYQNLISTKLIFTLLFLFFLISRISSNLKRFENMFWKFFSERFKFNKTYNIEKPKKFFF